MHSELAHLDGGGDACIKFPRKGCHSMVKASCGNQLERMRTRPGIAWRPGVLPAPFSSILRGASIGAWLQSYEQLAQYCNHEL